MSTLKKMLRKLRSRKKSEETTNEEGRRNFLVNAALGTGALTLGPISLQAKPTEKSSSTTQDFHQSGPYEPTVDADGNPVECWPTPYEWNVNNHGPNDFFQLNVIEHPFPTNILGEDCTQNGLFSYNGHIPGPTIRLTTEGNYSDILVDLVNSLSGNNGTWANEQASRYVMNDKMVEDIPDWQIQHHLYGPHQQHTTNLHTHGLHVSPGFNNINNPSDIHNNTHSDNVILRLIPHEDFINRTDPPQGQDKIPLKSNEVVGDTKYDFHLGTERGPHYPGTFWYHPHPHGATYDQVASGMAGFIIIEGEQDEMLKKQLKPNGYRERLFLFQRIVEGLPTEAEGLNGRQVGLKAPVAVTLNGKALFQQKGSGNNTLGVNDSPLQAVLRPGQIERWRILNGSVDGQGYIRFFVTKTTYTSAGQNKETLPSVEELWKNMPKALKDQKITLEAYRNMLYEPLTPNDISSGFCHNNLVPLDNLAYDSITLVSPEGKHTTQPVSWMVLAPANRADFLFEAPQEAGTYTIWAQWMKDASDRTELPKSQPTNIRIGHGIVSGDAYTPYPRNLSDGKLQLDFPEVPTELKPIGDKEITIDQAGEKTEYWDGTKMVVSSGNQGKMRTRRVVYSGWGHASIYGQSDQSKVTRNDVYNAMCIDGKKFGANTPEAHGFDTPQHRMIENTAEEWTLFNYSMSAFKGSAGTSNEGKFLYGKSINSPEAKDFDGSIRSVHHPFHIHQNPFYVLSVQDAEGNELLPLASDADGNLRPMPRWQDVVYIPRNGGRVIFRSRFWDYVGEYVDHCHLLQHEDWGMMQAIAVVPYGLYRKRIANYVPQIQNGSYENNWPCLDTLAAYWLDLGKVNDILPKQKGLYYPPTTASSNQNYFDQNMPYKEGGTDLMTIPPPKEGVKPAYCDKPPVVWNLSKVPAQHYKKKHS